MIEEQICGTINATITKSISIPFTLQFQIIGGVLIKKGGSEATDNLNINKPGVQIKAGRGCENVVGQKWQPVITNYGCPKQLLTVEKHQYNFSCSLHLYIKQNGTFLITKYSTSCSSCSISLTRCCWGSLFPFITDN